MVYSPAGPVALLVLAHPDSKFREWAASMGVDWMASDWDTFVVGEGFWKGITGDDLEDCFCQSSAFGVNTATNATDISAPVSRGITSEEHDLEIVGEEIRKQK